MTIPTEVLKIVSIFMKDGTDHTLNGGGVVSENHNGPFGRVIHTISGSILLPKRTDTVVNLITLLSKVLLTPFNGQANNGPNLFHGHLRGGGL